MADDTGADSNLSTSALCFSKGIRRNLGASMRILILFVVTAFGGFFVGPHAAQASVESVSAAERTSEDAAERVRKIIVSEDVIFAAMQQFSIAPVLETIILYPEIETLLQDEEIADEFLSTTADIWQSELRNNYDEFSGQIETGLRQRHTSQELERLAEIGEADEQRLVPVLGALSAASVTFTNQGLTKNEQVMLVLADLRAAGGNDLIAEHNIATKRLVVWLEQRKDQAYSRMIVALLATATGYLPDIPNPLDLEDQVNLRADLRAIFSLLSPTKEERSILVEGAVEQSLDSLGQGVPAYARVFAQNEGLKPHLRTRMIPAFRNTIDGNYKLMELGFVRAFASKIDEARSARLAQFLQSGLGRKMIGDVTKNDAKELTQRLIETQQAAADLEEASDDALTAQEGWAQATSEALDLTDDEAKRLDIVLEGQIGEDLYSALSLLNNLSSVQASLGSLRQTPRHSVIMQQEMDKYLRDKRNVSAQ